jgi:Domain of unknown function (DUF1833)
VARTLSSNAMQALLSEETGEVFLLLITITHASLGAPIYVTSDSQPTVSNGNTFQSWPFAVTLPDDDAQSAPAASITFDAVDQTVADAVAALPSAPSIQIQVVAASTPDTIEMESGELMLRNVKTDILTMSGDLAYDNVLNEAFPGRMVTPTTVPGVFSMEQ